MNEITLAIGQMQVTVRAPASLLAVLQPRWRLYQGAAGRQDLVLDVETLVSVDALETTENHYPNADAVFDGTTFRFTGDGFAIELVPGSPARARCQCTPRAILVESALRLCLSALAPASAALLLHASALTWEGAGFVFAGPKNAGKSTTLKLLAGDPRVRSLGDEVAFVRLTDAGATVSSTPFGWKYEPVPPATMPLRRLYCLVPPTRVLDSPARRAIHVFGNVLTTAAGHNLDPTLLALVHALVERVDCCQIYRPTRAELEGALSD